MILFTNSAVAVRQLREMLDLQYRMNTRVETNWVEQGFPWYRAIWTESAELLDHYGWKWWKLQEPDNEQVKLELVDIWHFGMSALLQEHKGLGKLELELAQAFDSVRPIDESWDFSKLLELFVLKTLSHRGFDLQLFGQLMICVDMNLDELYALYIGKNVLNFFRQDNGYKEGTYQKIWNGREDNEVLMDILVNIDPRDQYFRDNVEAALKANYAQATQVPA